MDAMRQLRLMRLEHRLLRLPFVALSRSRRTLAMPCSALERPQLMSPTATVTILTIRDSGSRGECECGSVASVGLHTCSTKVPISVAIGKLVTFQCICCAHNYAIHNAETCAASANWLQLQKCFAAVPLHDTTHASPAVCVPLPPATAPAVRRRTL